MAQIRIEVRKTSASGVAAFLLKGEFLITTMNHRGKWVVLEQRMVTYRDKHLAGESELTKRGTPRKRKPRPAQTLRDLDPHVVVYRPKVT